MEEQNALARDAMKALEKIELAYPLDERGGNALATRLVIEEQGLEIGRLLGPPQEYVETMKRDHRASLRLTVNERVMKMVEKYPKEWPLEVAQKAQEALKALAEEIARLCVLKDKPLTGDEYTMRWIEKWNLRDSEGILHRPYGILTWTANVIVWVCFDNNYLLGRRIWAFDANKLREFAVSMMEAGALPTPGARVGTGKEATGYGFKFSREQIKPLWYADIADNDLQPENYEMVKPAMRLVAKELSAMGVRWRLATKKEDQGGTDLVGNDDEGKPYNVEVKSRATYQVHDDLYLQVCETNSLKLWK
jgi:predicted RecB family endonuclease